MSLLDFNGYPTEGYENRVATFHGTPREFMALIDENWWPESRPDLTESETGEWRWELHTWGWSGNEETMVYLRSTWFWMWFWEQSTRGGHTVFLIPDWQMDRGQDLGYMPGSKRLADQ